VDRGRRKFMAKRDVESAADPDCGCGFLVIGMVRVGRWIWGRADNPLWFYLGAVLQFPASLLFRPVLGLVTKVFPDEVHSVEVAGAVVAVVEFVLLAVVIKKPKDYWLA
jgi:hypothetical protein